MNGGTVQPVEVGSGVTRNPRPAAFDTNVHLIAAAPELFALALQYRDDLRHPPSDDSRVRRIDAINATIAKARGEA